MKRGMSGLSILFFVVSVILLFRCSLPDPADPAKTLMIAVFKNAESKVFGTSIIDTVGKPLCIGAAMYLPSNFDSIKLVIREGDSAIYDTMFRTFNDDYFYDTAWCTITFTSEGLKTVTLTPYSNPLLQELTTNIAIYQRPVFTTTHITFLKNSTSATGSMPVQACTSEVMYKLPKNVFVNSGYRFSGWAVSPEDSAEYKDEDKITIGNEDLVLYAVWEEYGSVKSPVIADVPSQLIAGKPDTLVFTVDNLSRSDTLSISMITKTPLDPAVFSVVPSGPDTIRIAVAQSAQSASADIGIVTSNGTWSDTVWYPITLASSDTVLWTTASKDLDAMEGRLVNIDLQQYFSVAGSAGVSLSADIGTISGTIWSYTPEWGCAVTIPAVITAKKGDMSHVLTINLNVAAGDTVKPTLNLVDASLDGKKVSSSQMVVECKATDAGAAVDSVIFSYGTKKIPGILQGKDIYSGVITGLVHNTPVLITVSATDKSRQKNSAVITFTVRYDSTEGRLPEISAQPQSQQVEMGQSVTFSVTTNGFGTITYQWRLNEGNISGATNATYTISSVAASMNNNSYDCVVKNEVGEAISNAAKLTVTEIPSFTVSFYVQYGSPTPATQNVKRGEYATRPIDPVRSGYTLKGWYINGDSQEFSFNTTPVTADLKLVCDWTPIEYTITYNLDGGSNGSNPATYKVTDTAITLKEPGKNGSVFDGWYSDATFSTKVTTIPAGSTGNKVFWAKWTRIKYTIEFIDNDCGNGAQSYTVDAGTFFTDCPSLTDSSGAKLFNGWSENVCNTYINGHKTMYAQWKANAVTIYWHCIDPRVKKSETLEYGSTSIPNAFTTQEMQDLFSQNRGIWSYENCDYSGWYEDAECLNYFYYDGLPITKNINLYAKTLSCSQE